VAQPRTAQAAERVVVSDKPVTDGPGG